MANWTTNYVNFYGPEAEIQKVREILYGSNGAMDFNRLLPMPNELDIESSTRTDEGINLVLAEMPQDEGEKVMDALYKNNSVARYFNSFHPASPEEQERFRLLPKIRQREMLLLGQQAVSNVMNYGYKDWYDWCLANWGTKWNASDAGWEGDCLIFMTANGRPDGIEAALNTLLENGFPEVSVIWNSVDEGEEDD